MDEFRQNHDLDLKKLMEIDNQLLKHKMQKHNPITSSSDFSCDHYELDDEFSVATLQCLPREYLVQHTCN